MDHKVRFETFPKKNDHHNNCINQLGTLADASGTIIAALNTELSVLNFAVIHYFEISCVFFLECEWKFEFERFAW